MPELHTNGFIITISPTKHAHLTKPSVMIMVSDVQHKSNVEIVYHKRDAGLNKEPKFIALINLVMLLEKKT